MSAPRQISQVTPDPTALKALAHPMRLRMLGLLRIEGPATATSLAARLGLNSGATSYHLRQLALHGFIEEDADRGSKRDRWWRARHEMTQYLAKDAEGDALDVGLAFERAALNWQFGQMQASLEAYPDLAQPWRMASITSDYTMVLSARAAADLVKKIQSLLQEASAKAPALGGDVPEGSKPFTVILHAAPHVAEPGEPQ